MGKKIMILALTIALIFSGCWNRRELNQLAIVLGLGIDREGDGQVRISVQVVKPGEIGGEQKGGGSAGSPSLVLTTEGRTVFDAVRNFIELSGRKMFFSHNQVIIFGEGLARQGLKPVIDWIERDAEPRTEVPVLIARGEAENILKLSGVMEKLSAMEIKDSLLMASLTSKAGPIHYRDFLQSFASGKTGHVAPGIEIVNRSGRPAFRITGTAVFKRDKLTGWLNERETRGMLWVKGKVKSAIIVVPGVGQRKGDIAIEVLKAGARIEAAFEGGKPLITVHIKEEGNIGEVTGFQDTSKPEIIRELQNKQADVIKSEIWASIKKAQKEFKADIFGFAEELHRSDPKSWGQIKEHWEEEFSRMEVRLDVKSIIRRPGQKSRPTVPK